MQNILDQDLLGIHHRFLELQDEIDFNLEEIDENMDTEGVYNSGSSAQHKRQ